MPPKQQSAKKKKPQRVRVTNKALESRQFSTVRLPRSNEVPEQKVDVQAMFNDLGEAAHNNNNNAAAAAASRRPAAAAAIANTAAAAAAAPSSSGFDPIVNDPMFSVVAKSLYWPPPTLEELHARTGRDVGDGFDSYDRRQDDKDARKERVKVVKGEVNHPRGKARQNTIVKLEDSSESEDEGA